MKLSIKAIEKAFLKNFKKITSNPESFKDKNMITEMDKVVENFKADLEEEIQDEEPENIIKEND